MSTLQLTTNLKLIESVLTAPPTTAQLPKGYMAFGYVDGRASIWGNISGSEVIDLVQAGTVSVEVLQTTGTSTTAVMSQNSVTIELNAKVSESLRNVANGFAGLDANNKIHTAQLPSIAITDTYVVSSESEMLALSSAEQGDVAVRSDLNKSFILRESPYSTLSNWVELRTPTDAVLSVNGETGAVTITLEGLKNDSIIFTQSGTRENIVSGDTLATMLGKMSKWFADLSATGVVAFKTVSTTESGLIIDGSNNLKVNVGNGVKINASNQVEADIEITFGVI